MSQNYQPSYGYQNPYSNHVALAKSGNEFSMDSSYVLFSLIVSIVVMVYFLAGLVSGRVHVQVFK